MSFDYEMLETDMATSLKNNKDEMIHYKNIITVYCIF